MQILASALPGFRDLRAPIVAGYMWLLLAWLWVNPDLDHPPQTGLGDTVYDLFHRIGPIWVAIAAGVLAYLMGSISQDLSRGLRSLWVEYGLDFPIRGFERSGDERIRATRRRAEDLVMGRRSLLSGKHSDQLQRAIDARAADADHEAARELELPATLLVGDKSELFAEVDRLRAEGELRMAVVPPLIGLTAYLCLESSLWWLLVCPLIVVLFFQGLQRELDSKKSIADAIWMGRVESSSVSKFTQWVDTVLPGEIERAAKAAEAA